MAEKNVYERDSINYIPKAKQDFSFWNMTAIFMGMQVPVSYFIVGGAVTAGLTLGQALSMTILAFVVGFFIFSLIGMIGQQAGVTTMVASRPAFGILGSILPALITFIELAGWDSVHMQLAGVLMNAVSTKMFGFGNQALFSIIVGAIIVILVIFGARVLKVMEQFLVPAVLLLVLMALVVALGGHNLGTLLHKAGSGHLTLGMGFDAMLISALTWVPMVSDYTRFGKAKKATFWASLVGSVPVAFFMNGIGQLSSVSLGNANPIIPMVQHGVVFGTIAFIVVIFATIATAALILYSATISAVSIFSKVPVRVMGGIIGAICIGLAVGVNLLGNVLGWLNFQGYLLIPLFSVIVVDYFVVHKRYYNPEELFNKSGRFMYFKGFNLSGYAAWVIGAVTFFLTQHSAIGGSLLGMIASGLAYAILSRFTQARIALPAGERMDV